ncbi:MAG: hypothetical protein FWG16_05600 [Micrococcales bacterium]|nr:hypothetical protein [Micrococcales bacterium]
MTRKKLASGVGLALLALAIVPPSVALAADPVFVDANLEACVVATVGHSPVTEVDALALSDLACDGLNISSLAGLEGFTNLNSLSLRDNGITSIAQLASMSALASVDLGENMITDVSPLAGLGRIQQIVLDENWITDLTPLSPRIYALVTAENQWPPGFSGFVGQPFGMYTIFNHDSTEIPFFCVPLDYTVDAAGIYTFTATGNYVCNWELGIFTGAFPVTIDAPTAPTRTNPPPTTDGPTPSNQVTTPPPSDEPVETTPVAPLPIDYTLTPFPDDGGSPILPITGTQTGIIALLAVLLIGLGAGLRQLARRRITN